MARMQGYLTTTSMPSAITPAWDVDILHPGCINQRVMTLERPADDDTVPEPEADRPRTDRRLIGGLVSTAIAAAVIGVVAITGYGARDAEPVTTELRPAAVDEQVEPSTTVTTVPSTTTIAPPPPPVAEPTIGQTADQPTVGRAPSPAPSAPESAVSDPAPAPEAVASTNDQPAPAPAPQQQAPPIVVDQTPTTIIRDGLPGEG